MALWAALWRSENRLDGKREWILRDKHGIPALFNTRAEARQFIEDTHGYIRNRPDLRAEPHGWKMPIAVRVKVLREE